MPRTIIRLLTLATVTLLCLTAFAGEREMVCHRRRFPVVHTASPIQNNFLRILRKLLTYKGETIYNTLFVVPIPYSPVPQPRSVFGNAAIKHRVTLSTMSSDQEDTLVIFRLLTER